MKKTGIDRRSRWAVYRAVDGLVYGEGATAGAAWHEAGLVTSTLQLGFPEGFDVHEYNAAVWVLEAVATDHDRPGYRMPMRMTRR